MRWIRNLLVDGKKTSIEIQFGDKVISDKCYARVSSGREIWFKPKELDRKRIIEQGITIIKKQLVDKKITYAFTDDGEAKEYDWK